MSSWSGRSSVTAPTRFCAAEGCDQPAHAKGMCQLHYGRVRYAVERAERMARRRKDRELFRRRTIAPVGPLTYCGNCGTPATKHGHRDAWRDEGHRPFLVREAA